MRKQSRSAPPSIRILVGWEGRTFGGTVSASRLHGNPKALLFGLLADTPPPSINGSYAAGKISTGKLDSRGNPETRAALFHTEAASAWKTTATRSVSIACHGSDALLGSGPYCSLSWLFAFENADLDNRLKIVGDALQGVRKKGFANIPAPRALDDDKLVRRSLQFKTVVRRKCDVAFLHLAAPRDLADRLREEADGYSKEIEDERGFLLPKYEGRARELLLSFAVTRLGMEIRLG